MNIPLYQQIFRYILDEIRSGRFKSGDQIPTENDLAQQFNVSRITSKKALENLAHAGIIERARGKGSFVAHQLPDLDALVDQNRIETEPVRAPLIGLVLPNFSSSFGRALIYGIESACTENNCFMILKLTHTHSEDEEEAIKSLISLGVSGLIICPLFGKYYSPEVLRLALNKYPTVMVDRYLKGIPTSAVYTDNRRAAQELTTLLIESGHTEIGFISRSAEHSSVIEERTRGYSAALSEHGISVNPRHILNSLASKIGHSASTEGYLASTEAVQSDFATLRDFVANNPEITASVATEYEWALLLHNVLADMGQGIPRQAEIVCFDAPEKLLRSFPITHIQQDEFQMGSVAVQMLLEQINGDETPRHQTVDFKIVQETQEDKALIS